MKMLIGGKKVDSSSGKTIEVFNPATHELIDTVPAAEKEDLQQALENAEKGAAEWAATPLFKRIDILKKCLAAMDEHRQELGDMIVSELGVPVSQVQGEINTAIDRGSAALEAARMIGGESFAPSNCAVADGDLILTVREPLGIVLCIIPFNFPVGTFSTKVFPALVMGNAVIAKLPSDDPLAIMRLSELMLECGVPGNVLQVVTGRGATVGDYLNRDKRIGAISMTGSTPVGAQVGQDAAMNIAGVALELGGNDALIILDDADMEQAVQAAFANRSNRSGQICHSSKRILVPNSLKEEFLAKLAALIGSKKVGDPTDPQTQYGPVVSEKAAIEIEQQIAQCVEQGAKIVLGGKRFDRTFIEPTILDTPKTADNAHSMEIFGPTWTVVGYEDVDEALEIANDSIFGLNSGVIGKDIRKLMKVAKNIQAGSVVINGGGSFISPYAPFGGYKQSGVGRQSAEESIREFSQLKTIVFKKLY